MKMQMNIIIQITTTIENGIQNTINLPITS
jgi:hypothetical protein